MKTWKELVADSHGRACRKGWWDDCWHDEDQYVVNNELDPDKVLALVPEKLALIHSELSEALECYRKGEMTTYYTAQGKPEGFPVELADVVIRCADLLGALGVNDPRVGDRWIWDLKGVPAKLAEIHYRVSELFSYWVDSSYVDYGESDAGFIIAACFQLAKELGFDLWEAIETKATYNETRTYRHGGRKC